MRWLLLFLVLCCISGASAVVINEINPNGTEWLEIYNPANEMLNLSEWLIKDNSTQNPDTITCWTIPDCNLTIDASYFLILGRNTNITNITNSSVTYYYTDDLAIGNGLTDTGDNLTFYNSSFAASFNYSGSVSGESWQRFPDGSETIMECTPTPGLANYCADEEEPPPEEEQYDLELEVKIQNATEGVKAKNLFKLTNLDYKTNQPYMNVTVEFTVKLNDDAEYEDEFTVQFKQTKSTGTGNWTPQSFGEYRLCGKITDAPFEDNDEGNNDACGDITVYENKTAFEDVQENITNTTEGNVSITEKQNAAKNGRNYTIGAYIWKSKTTPSTAVLLFVGVLLILVVSLLLTAAGTKRGN